MNSSKKIVAFTTGGIQLTKSEYNYRLLVAEKQVDEGVVISQEELEKEVLNW